VHDPRLTAALTTLTLRQRRLRVATVLVLALVVVLVIFGLVHPFFNLTPPGKLTPEVRRALAVRGLLILLYWTVCMLLGLSLAVLAWLDIREVQRKLREHRAAMLEALRQRSSEDVRP